MEVRQQSSEEAKNHTKEETQMIPALDFVSRNEIYNVHAYDKRFDMAIVELVGEHSHTPFRVLLGFTYYKDYDYASMFPFESIREAFKLYDEIMRNTLVDNGAPRAEVTI